MSENKSARSLLGVVDDSGIEDQDPNRVRDYFSKFSNSTARAIITGLAWPVSLFAFNSNKIYLAILDLMLLVSCFVNGWAIYLFIGFFVGMLFSISIQKPDTFDNTSQGIRLAGNLIFLAFVFYFSFPLDYIAAESEIKSKSTHALSVDASPPDDEDFFIVELGEQSYKTSENLYASPESYAAFFSDLKPLADKAKEWSETGLGLPFFKDYPTKIRFIFADRSKIEIDLANFSVKPTVKFTQNFTTSSSTKKFISAGGTASFSWKGGSNSEPENGSVINVLYSSGESGPWSPVGTMTYGEYGAFAEIENPGPGFLRLQIPASTHLPQAESVPMPVPLD